MDAKQVAAKLIHAARFSVTASYSLFSYRDNDWALITSGYDANDIAGEYVRFAISGQWGDCLELRCDGRRVSLSDQLISDASLARIAAELRMQVAQMLKVEPLRLCVDPLCTNDREANIWIDQPTSGARICLTFTSVVDYSIEVEYPLHKDGEFAICKCNTLAMACEVFKFANAMLDDIRSAIGEII